MGQSECQFNPPLTSEKWYRNGGVELDIVRLRPKVVVEPEIRPLFRSIQYLLLINYNIVK